MGGVPLCCNPMDTPLFLENCDFDRHITIHALSFNIDKHRHMKSYMMLTVLLLSLGWHATAQGSFTKYPNLREDIYELYPQDTSQGWTYLVDIALDMSWIKVVNPRVGMGKNTTDIGGMASIAAYYNKKKLICDNHINLQVALVKEPNESYMKSYDFLQLTSKMGYRLDSTHYFANMIDIQTQMLPTYGLGYLYPKYVNGQVSTLTADFLSPAYIRLVPGLMYRTKNGDLSIISSLLAYTGTVFLKDSVTYALDQKLYPQTSNSDASDIGVQHKLGAAIRVDYKNYFYKNKVHWVSALDLYNTYNKNWKRIDFQWTNSVDFRISTNIAINLRSSWIYNHDFLVEKVDANGNKYQGRGATMRNVFMLKYSKSF
jgi:hypothetical protein